MALYALCGGDTAQGKYQEFKELGNRAGDFDSAFNSLARRLPSDQRKQVQRWKKSANIFSASEREIFRNAARDQLFLKGQLGPSDLASYEQSGSPCIAVREKLLREESHGPAGSAVQKQLYQEYQADIPEFVGKMRIYHGGKLGVDFQEHVQSKPSSPVPRDGVDFSIPTVVQKHDGEPVRPLLLFVSVSSLAPESTAGYGAYVKGEGASATLDKQAYRDALKAHARHVIGCAHENSDRERIVLSGFELEGFVGTIESDQVASAAKEIAAEIFTELVGDLIGMGRTVAWAGQQDAVEPWQTVKRDFAEYSDRLQFVGEIPGNWLGDSDLLVTALTSGLPSERGVARLECNSVLRETLALTRAMAEQGVPLSPDLVGLSSKSDKRPAGKSKATRKPRAPRAAPGPASLTPSDPAGSVRAESAGSSPKPRLERQNARRDLIKPAAAATTNPPAALAMTATTAGAGSAASSTRLQASSDDALFTQDDFDDFVRQNGGFSRRQDDSIHKIAIQTANINGLADLIGALQEDENTSEATATLTLQADANEPEDSNDRSADGAVDASEVNDGQLAAMKKSERKEPGPIFSDTAAVAFQEEFDDDALDPGDMMDGGALAAQGEFGENGSEDIVIKEKVDSDSDLSDLDDLISDLIAQAEVDGTDADLIDPETSELRNFSGNDFERVIAGLKPATVQSPQQLQPGVMPPAPGAGGAPAPPPPSPPAPAPAPAPPPAPLTPQAQAQRAAQELVRSLQPQPLAALDVLLIALHNDQADPMPRKRRRALDQSPEARARRRARRDARKAYAKAEAVWKGKGFASAFRGAVVEEVVRIFPNNLGLRDAHQAFRVSPSQENLRTFQRAIREHMNQLAAA